MTTSTAIKIITYSNLHIATYMCTFMEEGFGLSSPTSTVTNS